MQLNPGACTIKKYGTVKYRSVTTEKKSVDFENSVLMKFSKSCTINNP